MYLKQDIAIVILNWNGKQLLEQFLPSVIQYSHGAKVYLVDNASTDSSVQFVEGKYPDVNIIKHNENFGFAEGYNKALEHIGEPILCLLNNDVEVTHQWLDPILRVFNSDNNIGIIQPKLLDYNNRQRFEYSGAAGGFIDRYGYPFCRGRVFNHIEDDNGQYNDTKEILWASGACFFIKNSVYKKLNGFDDSFFAHMEEIDLCWRAFNENIKTLYVGTSEVYHVGGATLNNQNPQKTYLNFRNSLYTLVKNTDKHLLGRLFVRMVLDGIAGLRFVLQFKLMHFVAILKAHGSFYLNFSRLLKERKQLNKRPNYYKVNSIVWSYFIKKKTLF